MIINSLHPVHGSSQRCAEWSFEVNVHPFSWNGGSGICMLLHSFCSGFGHPACITAFQCTSDLIAQVSHGLLQQSFSNMSKLVMDVIDVHSLTLIRVNLVAKTFFVVYFEV